MILIIEKIYQKHFRPKGLIYILFDFHLCIYILFHQRAVSVSKVLCRTLYTVRCIP